MFGIVLNFTLVVNVKSRTRLSSLGVGGMVTMLTEKTDCPELVHTHTHTHNYPIVCINENPITSR